MCLLLRLYVDLDLASSTLSVFHFIQNEPAVQNVRHVESAEHVRVRTVSDRVTLVM